MGAKQALKVDNKITVEARSLASRFAKLLPLVGGRQTVPVLSTVRLRRRSAELLEIVGTDLDLQVTLTCPAEIQGELAVCVDPRRIGVLLKELGTERVTLGMVGSDLHVTWAGGRARFNTLPFDDFPVMTPKGDQRTGALEASFVTDVLMRVRPAISTEKTRYYLNGVCLDGKGETPTAVATDGHRLMACGAGDGITTALGGSAIIVPRDFVERWIALGRGDEAELTVHGSSHAQVVTADAEIVGKLIDGTFPDWRRVVPKDASRVWEAPRAQLQLALRKLEALALDRSPMLTTMPGDGLRMQLTGAGGYGGAIEVTVADAVGTLTEARGFNLRYVRAAVDATRGATVRLAQARPSDPAVVIGSDDAVTSHVILMPARVTGDDAFTKPQGLRRAA